jgi:hypothetical protein
VRYHKENDIIDTLNVELGVAAQYSNIATKNSDIAKWRTLEAYGQYILWLEKILLKNQEGIRK